MANNSFDINKTNNHKTNPQHINVSAIAFTGYTQIQKIVNRKTIEIFGMKKTTMYSQGCQPLLRSHIHEGRYPYF